MSFILFKYIGTYTRMGGCRKFIKKEHNKIKNQKYI